MKKTYLQRGFTLIELLVVISIIGILSSVVLASLNTARNKSADAAVKSNLANARAQAALFYNDNLNSYDRGTAATDVCSATGVANGIRSIYQNVLAAAKASGGSAAGVAVDAPAANMVSATIAVCNSNSGAWAAEAKLKNGAPDFYCVDSTGASRQSATDLLPTANETVC